MRKGYTIIEFLTVASMIGIMASITLPSFQSLQNEAKIIKAKAEVKTLQSIVEKYHKKYGKLPINLNLENFDSEINITKRLVKDPFGFANESYAIRTGKTQNQKNYYIIYSKGENGLIDFTINNNKVYTKNDDIIATNLVIIEQKI